MFLRLNQRVRLMICFLVGLCVTVFLSGVSVFNAQPARAAVGSNPLKAPIGYYQSVRLNGTPVSDTAASHQAPNFYN